MLSGAALRRGSDWRNPRPTTALGAGELETGRRASQDRYQIGRPETKRFTLLPKVTLVGVRLSSPASPLLSPPPSPLVPRTTAPTRADRDFACYRR